jgi:hypothetical protein
MSDVTAAAVPAAAQAPPARSFWWKEASGFSFHDLLDIINPLQHLPVIGTVYRWLTGDEPGNVARVIGDGIYGGPIGLGTSLVNVALENKQGQDLGEQALTMLFGPGNGEPTTAVAAATPTPAPAAAPAANTAPPPAPPPAVPDHPPMPLYGGVAQPVPARTSQNSAGMAAQAQNLAAAASAAQNPSTTSSPAQSRAAQEFLAKAQAFQRQAGAQSAHSSAPPTALVPLVLPPGALPAQPAPNAATVAAAAAAAPAAPATPGQPLDVSQKMLDALDKYMRLEQQRKAASPAAPASSVDLTL